LKTLFRTAAADRDVDTILERYLAEGGTELALRFVDAFQLACDHLSRHPGTGSPRYGHELEIPGLRSWPMGEFPYLLFYYERAAHVELWRVLHGRRDIPTYLQDLDPRQ